MAGTLKTLDREGFLRRFSYKDVALPDGSAVRVRALPASYVVDGPDDRFSPVNLLVSSLCDENGAPLFAGDEGEQAMAVDSASLRIILDAILDLNGLSRDEAGAPEKN